MKFGPGETVSVRQDSWILGRFSRLRGNSAPGQTGQNPPRRAGCCAGYLARHLAFFPEGVVFRPKGWYYTFTCTHAVLWADTPEIRVVWPKQAGRNGPF